MTEATGHALPGSTASQPRGCSWQSTQAGLLPLGFLSGSQIQSTGCSDFSGVRLSPNLKFSKGSFWRLHQDPLVRPEQPSSSPPRIGPGAGHPGWQQLRPSKSLSQSHSLCSRGTSSLDLGGEVGTVPPPYRGLWWGGAHGADSRGPPPPSILSLLPSHPLVTALNHLRDSNILKWVFKSISLVNLHNLNSIPWVVLRNSKVKNGADLP